MPLSTEQRNEFLSLFWQHTPDYALVLLDVEGMILDWGGAAETIFGYSAHEVIGQSVDVLFSQEDIRLGIPQLERNVAAANGRAEDDRWHVRKDGARIWISGTLMALRRGETRVGYCKVMRDRSDLRMQFEALRNRNEHLERRLSVMEVSFTRFVHEIRNSLGPLGNALQLLAQPSL